MKTNSRNLYSCLCSHLIVGQPDKGVLILIQVTVKFVDFGGILCLLMSVSNMVMGHEELK